MITHTTLYVGIFATVLLTGLVIGFTQCVLVPQTKRLLGKVITALPKI